MQSRVLAGLGENKGHCKRSCTLFKNHLKSLLQQFNFQIILKMSKLEGENWFSRYERCIGKWDNSGYFSTLCYEWEK